MDSWSGHKNRLWIWSTILACMRGNRSMFPSRISVSLPLSLKSISVSSGEDLKKKKKKGLSWSQNFWNIFPVSIPQPTGSVRLPSFKIICISIITLNCDIFLLISMCVYEPVLCAHEPAEGKSSECSESNTILLSTHLSSLPSSLKWFSPIL